MQWASETLEEAHCPVSHIFLPRQVTWPSPEPRDKEIGFAHSKVLAKMWMQRNGDEEMRPN